MRHYDITPSPYGDIVISCTDDGLTGLWFTDHKHLPALEDWHHTPDHPILRTVREQLNAYFEGELTEFAVPVAPQGTPFQEQVWQALLSIDYGTLSTYGDLAIACGLPKSKARAVGGAVGRNPISIIVPCHRVIGQNGTLTGYSGGVDRKRNLLDLERRIIADQQPEFELTA